jgi:hypothetical protein
MTGQEARITQAQIDRILAGDLMGRAVFFGQSDVNSLLEVGQQAFTTNDQAYLTRLLSVLWPRNDLISLESSTFRNRQMIISLATCGFSVTLELHNYIGSPVTFCKSWKWGYGTGQ